jgi:hypothetical protein
MHDISKSIFDAMFWPLPIRENGLFIKVWTEIIEYTTIAIEKINSKSTENFPECLADLIDEFTSV